MTLRVFLVLAWCCATCCPTAAPALGGQATPQADYQQVAPLLQKYCGGCHNDTDAEADFSVSSYESLMRGSRKGAAVTPENSATSRLWRLVSGDAEPRMPPAGEAAPSPAELAVIQAWIDAGAAGPEGAEPPRMIRAPRIQPADAPPAVTAAAYSSDGRRIATAAFQRVDLLATDNLQRPLHSWTELPGKVNSLQFVGEQELLAATGVIGLSGEAWLLGPAGARRLHGDAHRDALYAATLSPDGSVLATAGYDRDIRLWDAASGELLRVLQGHNGAVFSLAFHPSGLALASASADETVKIWRVADGLRLDTLSQPLDEQNTVAFSPEGDLLAAAGADNRIRVYRFVSLDSPRINPLLLARFAHEAAILRLRFSADGGRLASAAADRTLKVWDTRTWTELLVPPAAPAAIGDIALRPDGQQLAVAMLNGRVELLDLAADRAATAPPANQPEFSAPLAEKAEPPLEVTETEPNDGPDAPQDLPALPAAIQGVVSRAAPAGQDDETSAGEFDYFRFPARAGETWLMEVRAARDQSPLDSFLAVLDAAGDPVPRVMLQAVRDSYFTFRGKDSNTSDDFRLHNWEEMELDEYLYANGEVVKLWLYPRGPDSGFKVYPGEGNRYGFFDTTPLAHALNEPCYVVRPHPPGASLTPNGLPVFPVYYENDDDALRRWGGDSSLMFTAPADGQYTVRISDVRGFGGEQYKYRLIIRRPQPDFQTVIEGFNPKIPAGGGREFSVRVDRLDGYQGPVRLEIANPPPGLSVTSPIIVQAGQIRAYGQWSAAADAAAWSPEELAKIEVTASAEIGGRTVSHAVPSGFDKLELAPPAKVRVVIEARPDSSTPANANQQPSADSPLVLEIRPGQTISATVRVERAEGFANAVSFGKEDSGRNMPHGVFVDNIGLNGLMLLEGQSEREFFVTASPIAEPGERLFHLVTDVEGRVASPPVVLRVLPPSP